jgi:hypothetical protein
LPATFQDLKFGIKFMLSSKVEIIDGGEGLNSSHFSSTCDTSPLLPFLPLSLRLMKEDILDVVSPVGTLLSANK